MVPVVKKGAGENVEDYRGITLTQTAYKVYASVLAERVRVEVEGKRMLRPSQTRFRGGSRVHRQYICTKLPGEQAGDEEG